MSEAEILHELLSKIDEIRFKVRAAYMTSHGNCGNCKSCDVTREILGELLEEEDKNCDRIISIK